MSRVLFFIFCISASLICVENNFLRNIFQFKNFSFIYAFFAVLISKLFTWPFFMGPYSLLMLSISLSTLFHMPCLPVVVSENLQGFISFLLILLTVPCLCILCLTVSYYFSWNFICGKSLRTELYREGCLPLPVPRRVLQTHNSFNKVGCHL